MAASIINVVLGLSAKSFDDGLKKAQRSLEKTAKQMEGVGRTMSMYLTAPIVAAGGYAIKMASDFQESLNKVDVAFGSSSDYVKNFAKTTLDSFGIAEGSALDMAALFGDMSTSMGISQKEAAKLSTSLVGLAGDVSSFKNMKLEEVTTALNGVFTGETESLKRLGVVMTEVNLKQFAIESGVEKLYDEMTQGEKVMLRYNYVMTMLANSQGDFERTGGGAANQMRVFQESMDELSVALGDVMLPAFTRIITEINQFIRPLKELDESTKRNIIGFGLFAAALGPVLIITAKVMQSVSLLLGYMRKIPAAIAAVKSAVVALNAVVARNPIGMLATLLTLAAGSLIVFRNRSKEAATAQDELKESIEGVSEELGKQTFESLTIGLKRNEKGIYEFTGSMDNLRAAIPKLTRNELESLKLYLDKIIPEATRSTINETNNLIGEVEKVNLQKYQDALSLVSTELKKLDTNTESASGSISLSLQKIIKNIQAIESVKSPLVEEWWIEQVDDVNAKMKDLIQLMSDFKGEFRDMPEFKINFIGNDEEFASRIENSADRIASAIGNAQTQALAGTAEIIGSMAAMGASFDQIAVSVGRFLLATLGDLMIQVGTAAIATGETIEAIKAGLLAFLGVPAIVAGIALVGLGAAVKGYLASTAQKYEGSPTPFADGGIVSSPTNALIGEYPGASRNPEVVAPLDKLTGIMANALSQIGMMPQSYGQMYAQPILTGGATMQSARLQVEVVGRLDGKDIYLSSKRYNNTINRTT